MDPSSYWNYEDAQMGDQTGYNVLYPPDTLQGGGADGYFDYNSSATAHPHPQYDSHPSITIITNAGYLRSDDEPSSPNTSSPLHPPSPGASPTGSSHSADAALSTPSSPLSSEGYLPTTPEHQLNNSGMLTVELQHKPRGSQGVWKPVNNHSRIRVTYGRGKNLRMLVRSPVEVDWSQMKVALVERLDNQFVECTTPNTFSMEARKMVIERPSHDPSATIHVCQIDLKLFIIHKTIAFCISLPGPDGQVNHAFTVQMSTHNSGRRDDQSRQHDEEEEDDNLEPKAKRHKPSKSSMLSSSESSETSGADSLVNPALGLASSTGRDSPAAVTSPTSAMARSMLSMPSRGGSGPLIGIAKSASVGQPQGPPQMPSFPAAASAAMPPNPHQAQILGTPHPLLPPQQAPNQQLSAAQQFALAQQMAQQQQSHLGQMPPSPMQPRWPQPTPNTMGLLPPNTQLPGTGGMGGGGGMPPNQSQAHNMMHTGMHPQAQHPMTHQQHPLAAQMPPQPPQDPSGGPPIGGAWQVVPGNLQVDGMLRARAFLQYSDLRLKTNIEDIVDAMEIVCKLSGKSYQWRKGISPTNTPPDEIESSDFDDGSGSSSEEEENGKRVIGLIAQDVQKILPEVVHETENGFLSVNYVEIIPVLIEAFKAHFKDFESFKGELDNEIATLRKDVKGILNAEGDGDIKASELYQEIHVMKARIHDMNNKLGRRNSLTSLLQSTKEKMTQSGKLSPVGEEGEVELLPKKHIESSSASTTTTSALEASTSASGSGSASVSRSASVSHSGASRHVIEVDLSTSVSDASDNSTTRIFASGMTSKVTSVSAHSTDDKVSIQLNVTNKDKHWKILTILLSVLVVLALGVALYIGLAKPGVFPAYQPTLLTNPMFYLPDPDFPDRALWWSGNYRMLHIPVPDNLPFLRPRLKRAPTPPAENFTAQDFDDKTDDFWQTIPALTHPTLPSPALLHLFVNSSDPNLTPSLARQKNRPSSPVEPGQVAKLNVTVSVFAEFTFPENAGGLLELDVSITYTGQPVPEFHAVQFNVRERTGKWQTISTPIELSRVAAVEQIEVQCYQSYVGHSFWNLVAVSFIEKSAEEAQRR